MSRSFYVGAREDLAMQQQRAAKARKIKEAQARQAGLVRVTDKFEDVELKDQTVYTQPPQEPRRRARTAVSKTCRNPMTTARCPRSCARCASSKTTWTRRRRCSRTLQRRRTASRGSPEAPDQFRGDVTAEFGERRRTARVGRRRRSARNAMIVRRRGSKGSCGGATPSRRSRSEDAFATACSTLLQGSCDGATPAPKWRHLPRRRSTKQRPAFGQSLIGAAVEVNVDGMWLRAEIVEVGAALADLDGANGVCVRFADEAHTVTEEWRAGDEIRIARSRGRNTRAAFGASIVGTYVQVHVVGLARRRGRRRRGRDGGPRP